MQHSQPVTSLYHQRVPHVSHAGTSTELTTLHQQQQTSRICRTYGVIIMPLDTKVHACCGDCSDAPLELLYTGCTQGLPIKQASASSTHQAVVSYFVILSCHSAAAAQAEVATSISSSTAAGLTPYVNKQQQYRFSIPADWQRKDKAGKAVSVHGN